jgi:hypothetical protein
LTVAFYLDENVQRAITAGLRLRGVEALTVQEDGRAGAPDSAVLDRATELARPVFSHDVDLLSEGQRRLREGISFPGVVYAHQTRTTIGECVRDLELIAKTASPEDLVNRILFLPI